MMSKIAILSCISFILSILLMFNLLTLLPTKAQQQLFPNPAITTPLVSTRGHFSLHTGELNSSRRLGSYDISNVPGFNQTSCSTNGIALYVHGVWAGQAEAREQLDRVKSSLNANGFISPVVGFTWDSNTAANPSGWVVSKFIANQNGPKLAKFISDFKDGCPGIPIRIIAHSLGARIVESTLVNLNNNQTWNNMGHKIDSIHLVGAAISDKATSRNTPFGAAINNMGTEFQNLYNPEDNNLQLSYKKTENQNPLGLYGLQKVEALPSNYTEANVRYEIPPLSKANGTYQPFCDFAIKVWGDNHCGYMGFRHPVPFSQFLKDDGAINVIVRDWNE